MVTEISGQIERITYRDEESSYTVARIKVAGRNDLVTVVGNLLSASPGESVRLRGQWHTHPRYGEQFKIESCESIIPATIQGIEKYLGSGLIKGIGPVMARRLVDRFGTETLDVIESNPDLLREVEGIGEKRIGMIRQAWYDQKEIRQVMVFLQGHGVSPSYSARIYGHYGRDSVRVVRENPYRLATDVPGIGFVTADRIAESLGIPRDSQIRAQAGILHVLQLASDDGHCHYPCDLLIDQCIRVLNLDEQAVLRALGEIAAKGEIVIEDLKPAEAGIKGKAVYLAKYHACEVGVARMLLDLMKEARISAIPHHEEAVAWVRRELNMELARKQEEAVRGAMEKKVMVVTGGPGTGKTALINAVIRICRKRGQRVLLAAPTGRAAKRLAEATGEEARTLHRLLEFSPREGRFMRDENAPLEADMIVVDEASMVDTILMYHFLKAVSLKANVILAGDVDQLPSVGAGNVLKDIIDSGRIATVRLTEIFRQARESQIVVGAHNVNNGRIPSFSEHPGEDFYFLEIEDPEKVLEKIIELYKEKIPNAFGYKAIDDIQVLTPMHRGVVGSANLNKELQKHLNPSADELVRSGGVLKVGDKVMQIRNDYDKEVFNGDIGRIAGISREDQEVMVDYDGRMVAYDFGDLDEISLAYAVSVHKSQGSEYPAVIMPVLTQHYVMLQRNLLYTGITRGKSLVVLLGTRKALAIAVRNDKPQKRYTRLRERLQEL